MKDAADFPFVAFTQPFGRSGSTGSATGSGFLTSCFSVVVTVGRGEIDLASSSCFCGSFAASSAVISTTLAEVFRSNRFIYYPLETTQIFECGV